MLFQMLYILKSEDRVRAEGVDPNTEFGAAVFEANSPEDLVTKFTFEHPDWTIAAFREHDPTNPDPERRGVGHVYTNQHTPIDKRKLH